MPLLSSAQLLPPLCPTTQSSPRSAPQSQWSVPATPTVSARSPSSWSKSLSCSRALPSSAAVATARRSSPPEPPEPSASLSSAVRLSPPAAPPSSEAPSRHPLPPAAVRPLPGMSLAGRRPAAAASRNRLPLPPLVAA
uniref:Uncharacterized protein n=1 Tax=Ixodes ricinus TaxID=34613 RepID=A0A6B0USL0_IXORI